MNALLPRPVLMLVTEPSARLGEIVTDAVAGGVNVVQLRDKTGAPDCLHETATLLRFLAEQGAGARLVVNGDWGVARTIDADGLHLPESGPPAAQARAAFGYRSVLVGRSVHSIEAAARAASEGVDYLIAGTIFASGSHPGQPGRGLDFLRAVCDAAGPVPVLAIGGVTPESTRDCVEVGAAGVAVLSPLMHADDPRAVAEAFWRAMNGKLP